MIRNQRQLVENRLEVLAQEKRSLDQRLAVTRRELAESKQRYEDLARYWQSVGADALLSDEDRALERRARFRSLYRGFALGTAVPLALGAATWLLMHVR